jgi:electron transfer flavoprotein beta subunit
MGMRSLSSSCLLILCISSIFCQKGIEIRPFFRIFAANSQRFMNILVCISSVPDTTSKISFTENDTKLDPNGITWIIGPYDDYALARAVELKEAAGTGNITVLHVGGADSEAVIRKALAIGADEAVRIDSPARDGFFVAAQIAAYAKDKNYDLILMGRESIDYNSGIVHGLVAEHLGIPAVSPVMKLEISGREAIMEREIEGGKETVSAALPLVLGCQEPIAEWKIPSMRGIMSARTKPLNVIPASDAVSGLNFQKYELPPARTSCKMLADSQVAELVSLLKSEAKVI